MKSFKPLDGVESVSSRRDSIAGHTYETISDVVSKPNPVKPVQSKVPKTKSSTSRRPGKSPEYYQKRQEARAAQAKEQKRKDLRLDIMGVRD
jgi:hypothetical protein